MNKIFRLLQKKLIPEVDSFNEAEKYCNSKMPFGYQSKLLCDYRFRKLDIFLKNGGKLIQGSSINTLLISLSYCLHLNNGKFPKILDYGGACGENILFLDSLFSKSFHKSSWVVETNAQVIEAKKWEFVRNIQFQSDLEKVLENDIEFFFTSCALNYVEEPYEILRKIVDKKIPFICLTRNNFSRNPKSFIQVSNLSDNGFGEHIKEYGNPLIWYPAQTLSEKKIKDIFIGSNYQIICEENLVDSGVINLNSNYSKDLVFHLKD